MMSWDPFHEMTPYFGAERLAFEPAFEVKERGDTFCAYERSFGSFTRSFTVPEDIDGGAIQANLEKGVLAITVPKKPESIAKRVPIASASASVPKKA